MSAQQEHDCYNIKINKKVLWITVISVILIAVILIGINVTLIRFSEKGKINQVKKEAVNNNMFYRVMNDGKVDSSLSQMDKAACNEVINLQKELDANNIKRNVIFKIPKPSYKVNGETFNLNEKEYEKFLDDCSKNAMKGLRDLTATDTYKAASAEGKAKMVQSIYSYSRAKARADFSPKYKNSDAFKKDYAKTALAEKKNVSAGEYIAFKSSLPEKYNEGDVWRAASESGYDDRKAELLVNLSKNYSAEQCERIDKLGGFKYASGVRYLYSDMKKSGYDCETLYVPVADKEFSYKKTKQGIDFKAKLNEKQIQTLQNTYIKFYEQALDKIVNIRFSSMQAYYKAVKKCRDDSRDLANKAFYYWLQKQN